MKPCVIGELARPLAPSFALNSMTAGGGGTGRTSENSRTLSLVLEVSRTATVAPAGTSVIVSVVSHLPSPLAVAFTAPYCDATWIAEPGWALP